MKTMKHSRLKREVIGADICRGGFCRRIHTESRAYVVKYVPKERVDAARREVYALKMLSYPGIPKLYETITDKNGLYIFMEEQKGETLCRYRCRTHRFPPEEVIRFGISLCGILDYMHRLAPQRILHLDIQPENLLLDRTGVKLIDFGNALPEPLWSCLKEDCGTPGFSAPELYRGGMRSPAADLFSVGRTLLYAVTGLTCCEDPHLLEHAILACRKMPAGKDREQSIGLLTLIGACTRFETGLRIPEAVLLAKELYLLLGRKSPASS